MSLERDWIWACWTIIAVMWLAGFVYNMVRGPRHERRDLRGLRFWLVPVILLYVLASRWPGQAIAGISLNDTTAQVAGLVLLTAFTAFTLWARVALGRMWSSMPVVKRQHRLRTAGPYRISRHPIYLGILGMVLGTALVSGSALFALYLPLVLVMLIYKIHTEERLMLETFGEEYRKYREDVPQLIPGIRVNL